MGIWYHVTKFRNLPSIMAFGLRPGIGERSQLCEEAEEYIYLCEKHDIPYWMVLLQADVVLTINTKVNICKERQYSCYNEVMTKGIISYGDMDIVNPPDTTDARLELQKNYLYSLCSEILYFVRAFHYEHVIDTVDLNSTFDVDMKIMNTLDYQSLDRDIIKQWLLEYGEDGEYTLLDTYMNEDTRLYQKLAEFEHPKTQEVRSKVKEWVETNLHGCLDIDTGGFLE